VGNFKTELPIYPPGGRVPNFILVNQQVSTKIIISTVAKGSPAEKAGIVPISQIISVNGARVETMDYFLSVVKANKGKKIVLEWLDLKTNKKSISVLVPRANPPKNEGALGISFFPSETISMNYQTTTQKLFSGFTHPTNLMVYNYVILKELVSTAIQKRNVDALSQGVSGPVGIATVVSAVLDIPDLRTRILELLNLAGILSISLAFFNVLPIPGLDGGRLFFIVVEGVFGLKLNPKVEGYINSVGMAFLFLLIILITYKDIMQQFVK
jgi:regulator of sigma E protease